MTRSRTSVRELASMDDVATPHERIDGTVRAVPHRNIDNIAPAGAILSSASDMSRWLLLMLGKGELDGKRILSEATVEEVWRPNIIYALPPDYRTIFPSMHFSTYGLGWGLRDYRGRLVATHTGGIDGMLSQVLVVPEEKIGIVVLTNTSPAGSPAENVVTFHILDALLGATEKTDWNARWKETWRKQEAAQKEQEKKLEESRVVGTSPSVALDAYAGEYENDMYGVVRLSLEDRKLVLRRHHAWVGDLEHWNYDTFRVRWRDPVMGKTLVTFRLSTDGNPTVVELEQLGEFHRVETEGSDSR
jgi:hypothetical protein